MDDREYKRKYEKALEILENQIEYFSVHPNWTIWKTNAPIAEEILQTIVDIVNEYITNYPNLASGITLQKIINALRRHENSPKPTAKLPCGDYPSAVVAYLQKLKEEVEQG